jgi:hypothetical protein
MDDQSFDMYVVTFLCFQLVDSRCVLRGGAVGNGPRRQIVGECINDMFKEVSVFRKLSDEGSGYYGSIISDFASTTRAHELRVAGFLTLLHLYWTGLLPLRISPCVVLATFLNDGLARSLFTPPTFWRMSYLKLPRN